MKTIIVREVKDISTVHEICGNLLAFKGAQEVTIRTYQETRKVKQHSLQWIWETDFADHFGTSKEREHFEHKRRFAVPIFIRDDPEYAEMVLSVRALKDEGKHESYEKLVKIIIENTSTTTFKVKQMIEFLNDLEMDAADKGVVLRFPEDQYQEAMGRKKKP